MGKLYAKAALCAILISVAPVTAFAQANINTSRSNTKGAAPPAEDAATAEGGGAEQQAGKKGYDYYQAKSDQAARAAGPDGATVPTLGADAASTTVPKQTQGATFGEKVNAGLQASGAAASQGTAAQTAAEVCKAPDQGKPAATTKPRQPRPAGEVKTGKGKPDDCNGLVR